MVKEKLTIEQLAQEVAQEINTMVPDAEVRVNEVKKINNLILHAICIMDKQEPNGITPTVYLDNYYEQYCNDELSVEEIAEMVIEISREAKEKMSFDIRNLTDFDRAKKNLRIKLISTEKNREFLETVAHKEFLDMSMIYQVKAVVEEDAVGTTVVTNRLLGMYGVSVDELHEAAFENMKESEPADIDGVTSKMIGLASEMGMDETKLEDLVSRLEDEPLLIISNKKNSCGASQILYKENLEKVASIFKDDFYIIPSSIHECLAVRTGERDIEGLRVLVKEINETKLLPEEVLSDNVYFYSIETGELKIA